MKFKPTSIQVHEVLKLVFLNKPIKITFGERKIYNEYVP
jgi:hypothetical protein